MMAAPVLIKDDGAPSNKTESDPMKMLTSTRDLPTQATISVALGLSAFLVFCVRFWDSALFVSTNLESAGPSDSLDGALCGAQKAKE